MPVVQVDREMGRVDDLQPLERLVQQLSWERGRERILREYVTVVSPGIQSERIQDVTHVHRSAVVPRSEGVVEDHLRRRGDTRAHGLPRVREDRRGNLTCVEPVRRRWDGQGSRGTRGRYIEGRTDRYVQTRVRVREDAEVREVVEGQDVVQEREPGLRPRLPIRDELPAVSDVELSAANRIAARIQELRAPRAIEGPRPAC